MFYLNPSSEPQVFSNLASSPFVFHLTGSRFFGNFHQYSDWDLFVEAADGLDANLRKMGFLPTNEILETYCDKSLLSVYKHETDNVHIQVVKNSVIKLKAQKLLFYYYSRTQEPLKFQAEDWNDAFIHASKI